MIVGLFYNIVMLQFTNKIRSQTFVKQGKLVVALNLVWIISHVILHTAPHSTLNNLVIKTYQLII